MQTTLIRAVLLALALAGVACGQDASGDEAGGAEPNAWQFRLGALMGGSYFSYEESLPGLDTEFSSGSFTARFSAELNVINISPFLRLQTHVSGGEETADLQNNSEQKTDLSVATMLLDVGLGYRIDLGESITLVPAAAYSFDLMSFDREKIRIDGVPVQIVDLNGTLQESVGESITGNGITGRLGVEIRPISRLDLHIYGVFTYLPDVRVDNDLGGTISTEGYIVRGGVSAYFWVHPLLGVGGEIEFLLRTLDKSNVKVRSGNMFTASVQFPDSDTVATAVSIGVMARF